MTLLVVLMLSARQFNYLYDFSCWKGCEIPQKVT